VIIPHAYDQFDNAARAKRLGVSATVHRTRVNAERLVAALREVLDDPLKSTRAAEIGKRLAGEDGAAVAVRAIERFVSGNASREPQLTASAS
jgi:UDP:flavonoid glycosyltransferase YjiC (YdhE family)